MKSANLLLKLFAIFIPFILTLLSSSETAKAPKDRLDYNQPYVTFYESQNHRGTYYHHYLKKECTNLPSQYDNWAASVNTYGRCVFVCEHRDCQGKCERFHGQGSNGLDRFLTMELSNKVSSVKFCYTFTERG